MALTPLIDVIFLLLLFFMLSSTFSRFGEIKLDLGGARDQNSVPLEALAKVGLAHYADRFFHRSLWG